MHLGITCYCRCVLLAALLACTSLTGCRKPALTTVKVGYLPISASLPAYVAIEHGYFADVGLQPQLVKFTSSNTMMTALLAGEIDIAACPSAVDVLSASTTFPGKFKIIRVGYTTQADYVTAVIVKKDSEFQSIADLAGRKIATFPGGTMRMYTRLVFQGVIGAPENVEIVQMAPRTQLQALASGAVDACVILEPTGLIGQQKGISRYIERGVVERYVSDPWVAGFTVVSQSFIDADARAARNAVSAFEKATLRLRSDTTLAPGLLVKYNALDRAVAEQVPVPVSWTSSEITQAPIGALIDLLVREGVLEARVDIGKLIWKP